MAAAVDPINSLAGAAGKKVVGSMVDVPTPAAPIPPSKETAPKAPDITVASDRARILREQEDAAKRKRGRSSSIFTGNEGVSSGPVGLKTLVGS